MDEKEKEHCRQLIIKLNFLNSWADEVRDELDVYWKKDSETLRKLSFELAKEIKETREEKDV